MWHLSEQYISESFRRIDQRFDALERSLTQQTRQLESDSYTKIRELEERINERLDTIRTETGRNQSWRISPRHRRPLRKVQQAR